MPGKTKLKIIPFEYLNHKEILTTLVEGDLDNDKFRLGFDEGIKPLLASQIIKYEIKEGDRLLFALMALIRRYIFEGIIKEDEKDDGTLCFLRLRLDHTIDKIKRVNLGIKLGDRALHLGAGLNARHLSRVMNDQELNNYTTDLAIYGYAEALNDNKKNTTRTNALNYELISPLVKNIKNVKEIVKNTITL